MQKNTIMLGILGLVYTAAISFVLTPQVYAGEDSLLATSTFATSTSATTTLATSTPVTSAAPSATLAASALEPTLSVDEQIIGAIWNARKDSFLVSSLKNKLDAKNTQVLYDTQTFTHNLLRYAERKNRYDLIDQIDALLLVAHPYLETRSTYVYRYKPGQPNPVTLPLNPPAPMWVNAGGEETVLYSAQFLALVSDAMRITLSVPLASRTQAMNTFVSSYAPVLASHYERWVFKDAVFQVRGWGCTEGIFSHRDFLTKKTAKALGTTYSYCNAVDDTDLLLIAGVSNMLVANSLDAVRMPLAKTTVSTLKSYLGTATALIKKRVSTRTYKNFKGANVTGAIFDAGAWTDHPDDAYAGYSGSTFPTEAQKKKMANIGWDTSHARRQAIIFDTLYKNRTRTGQSYPDQTTMARFAATVAYGVSNKNTTRPLFSNYMDGTNGWYRVNYGGKMGFGYGLFDATASMLESGFGTWGVYNSDITTLMNGAWVHIKAGSLTDPYVNSCYTNYARSCALSWSQSYSLSLLQFLPSIIK